MSLNDFMHVLFFSPVVVSLSQSMVDFRLEQGSNHKVTDKTDGQMYVHIRVSPERVVDS